MSEIASLKSENLKLRNYISLTSSEILLMQRIFEIKQNFTNPADSDCITVPILDRLARIKAEKQVLYDELNLI